MAECSRGGVIARPCLELFDRGKEQGKLSRADVPAAADQHYQDHRARRGGGVHREGVEISNHRRLAANLLRQPGKPASVSVSQPPMTQGKVRRLLNGEIISVIRL